MRQVRLDELTHSLFSGLGTWGHRHRKAVAADAWDRFDEVRLSIAASSILPRLYGCEFYEDPAGHPLSPKEMETVLAEAIRAWPRPLRQGFVSKAQKERDWTRYYAAKYLAGQLERLVVLRDSPEPPFFRFANFEGGTGPIAESDEEADRRRQET